MNVGILGYGTIGSGILSLVQALPAQYDVHACKVLDLPAKKELLGSLYTGNPDDICLNDDIDVVFEAMGGDRFAHECIVKALTHGKSVITSNKEVVALHYAEFYRLARQNNVYFLCEASVGGGIPCIRALQHEVEFDTITSVYGIINGTTNFILTRMAEGQTFAEALATAQQLGFAEADATADIEGLDMLRKICILSNIAYGAALDYNQIVHYGIGTVTADILADVKGRGKALKFVAQSVKDGDTLHMAVEPVIVDQTHLLAGVGNEYNAVFFDCRANGTLAFYGKGAGRYPTAAAMIGDLVDILQGNTRWQPKAFATMPIVDFADADYYVVQGGVARVQQGRPNPAEVDFLARILG